MKGSIGIVAIFLGVLLYSSSSPAQSIDKRFEHEFEKAVAAGNEAMVSRLIDDLRDKPGAEAAPLILEAMTRVQSERIFDSGLQVLKSYGADTLDRLFRHYLQESHPRPLIAAAIIAVGAALDGEKSEGWLLLALNQNDELVKRNAIDALEKRRSKKAIPKLIDIMAKEGIDHGTISFNAHRALISLTGRDFQSIEDWRSFWKTSGSTIDPKHLDAGNGKTGVKITRPDAPKFFGVEIVSHRVIFVIDTSGSMRLWDKGGEKGGSGSAWQVRQRIARTKRELDNAIRKLSKASFFNIIAFNTRVFSFMKHLVPATLSWKGKAFSFVRKLAANGLTYTDDAMRAAFKDPNVDTIILLSDGAPEKQHQRAQGLIPKILQEVHDLNRLRKVRIFTFGFEGLGLMPPGPHFGQPVGGGGVNADPMVDFLKQLAKDNGGAYQPIK